MELLNRRLHVEPTSRLFRLPIQHCKAGVQDFTPASDQGDGDSCTQGRRKIRKGHEAALSHENAKGNIDSNEIDIVIMDGRRMAMDIINPDNWTLDQDAVLTHSDSVGQNIGRLGVCWSLNEEPTEAELAAATRRLETHYRNLLTEAGVH